MTEIRWVGHDCLRPDQDKARAILDMPQPEDKAALMRFLGMVQYLTKFIPNLSEVTVPIRKLLEGEVAWHWESQLQKSFERLKSLVSNAPVLKFYDLNKQVSLSVDASSEGLGAVLMQERHPLAFGSRSLTDCQKRYAQVEKELLAIVYRCETFQQFLYGRGSALFHRGQGHKGAQCHAFSARPALMFDGIRIGEAAPSVNSFPRPLELRRSH
ncbi:hypothetical protein SKAU_G00181340 [Synaphobranchus kaupii]|uniref:Reverse transcriptase/retrotransposon-derived protein RNase H-like domain-containing protein n=1 Tax=Synaphobranchus kaupii TaxID=118154 RepID=A0A9Q1FMD0_SYNKA|nr:hypothetical protein SKAU_G00181340 [Synaphobranchus kaupii]